MGIKIYLILMIDCVYNKGIYVNLFYKWVKLIFNVNFCFVFGFFIYSVELEFDVWFSLGK